MMGLGYLGDGGPSSSSSSLSPLAPPFTVNRSNPKSVSITVSDFTEPLPYGVSYNSSLNNWQYPHSSDSGPDLLSNYHSEIDSTPTSSLSSANNYWYLGPEYIGGPPSKQSAPSNPIPSNPTNPFSFTSQKFHHPYSSQTAHNDSSLVGLNESNYAMLSTSGLVPMFGSSEVDYNQSLCGLEYPPSWRSFWNGLEEGKQGKKTEPDGAFHIQKRDASSLAYKDCMKQGAIAVDCFRECENDSAVSRIGIENSSNSLSKEQLNDKLLVQNLRFIPIESSKAPNVLSGTVSKESHVGLPYLELETLTCNQENSYGPREERFQAFSSCIGDCISVTKASPMLTIRSPVSGTKLSVSDPVSYRSVGSGSDASANIVTGDQSIKKEPHLPQTFDGDEVSLNAVDLSFHMGKEDQELFMTSSSNKEDQQNNLFSRNTIDCAKQARYEIQALDLNVSHGFLSAVASTEAYCHTANSSESLDNCNPAEDSPCWKGAPASHVSPFKTVEAMPLQHIMKKPEASGGLNFLGTRNFSSYKDSAKASSQEACETNLQKEGLYTDNFASLHPETNFSANSPAKSHTAIDSAGAKSSNEELNTSDRVKFSENADNPRKEYDLSNGFGSDSGYFPLSAVLMNSEQVKFTSKRKLNLGNAAVDAGSASTDTIEDCRVPTLAVENASCSASPREDAIKLHMVSSPKVNVQMLVHVMHNLSELLLFHCLNDVCTLEEQDCKALENAIRNIDMCWSKKIPYAALEEQSKIPREEVISHLFEEGAREVRPQLSKEVGAAYHDQLDSQSSNECKKNCDAAGKKFEKLPYSVYSRDDADISRQHNMVQDIKKTLKKHFQLDEEIHSENMLYKNLWLDAEAELCSLGFRARLDRVKIQMEKCKSDKAKENTMSVEKLPITAVCPELKINHPSTPKANDSAKQKASLQYSCISSQGNVDDAEASVMARFHILKCQGDSFSTTNVEEKQLPEVVHVGLSGIPNYSPVVVNRNRNKSFDVAVGSPLNHHNSRSNEDKANLFLNEPLHETMEELLVGATDESTVQPRRMNILQNHFSSGLGSGWYDYSPSDWEYVSNDGITWQN